MLPESAEGTQFSAQYLLLPDAPPSERGPVKAWEQDVEILTYAPGAPDRNPMFLEKRVYQGSSGKVYPLPFTDRIATEPATAVVEGDSYRKRIPPADDPA